MMLLLVTLSSLVLILLLVVAGVRPNRPRTSPFQLKKQAKLRLKTAVLDQLRHRLLIDVLSLQRVLLSVLIVWLTLLLSGLLGWLGAVLLMTTVAIIYGGLAGLTLLQVQSQKLYNHYELPILEFINTNPRIIRPIRSIFSGFDNSSRIESSDELAQTIKTTATEALMPAERAMLLASLSFQKRLVADVMTRRRKIHSIEADEMLGPLVLDDLHRTGNHFFPVTLGGDIDTIIGVLDVKSLLTLDVKKSTTAQKAMDRQVAQISDQSSLPQALELLLQQQSQILIVVDDKAKTAGLISLNDVIGALTGIETNTKN